MNIGEYRNYIKNKSVAVVGIGVSNIPLIKMLTGMGAVVTARDKKSAEQLGETAVELEKAGARLVLGDSYLDNLSEDIIFKTPGMRADTPELLRATANGSVITSEMQFFFELCPADIIAVTGSDGKTTTTTLIYEMLKAQGYKCHLGGNIGKPLIGEVDSISPDDKVVVELSSFQLQTMNLSPKTAVITNVSPNHLDIHKSMEEYTNAKRNIFLFQQSDGRLILNFDNDITKGFAKSAKGRVIPFGKSVSEGVHLKNGIIYVNDTPVLRSDDILLPGSHNVENYMAAIGAIWGIVSVDAVAKTAASFGGVAHRIEFVREKDGVKFYNDSIASSPTRARACLYSFDKKLIIIAGGYDKKIPFDEFGRDIAARVKTLVLLGNTAQKIKNAVINAKGDMPEILMATDLKDAVYKAGAAAKEGDIVILCPACASFDMFNNFEERGNLFKSLVMEL